MKAVLDHVGIAVGDVGAALAFYRDALGLEVEGTEEVASQRVRAHFIPTGESKLELLEATSEESMIAKYVAKRGAGLHHITLRVDDIQAALDHLRGRNVRLIDERPRPGAEGAQVAFIHPASAHGVLVELKQSAPGGGHHAPASKAPEKAVTRFNLGDFELLSLHAGGFRLDGGAMFGTVPKAFWAAVAPPDDRNRIALAMRPLVVRGSTRTVLIDAGIGDKENAKFQDIYGIDHEQNLDRALAEAGISPEDIDVVLATHLHFDHAGGFTRRRADGRLVPAFPRARYVVRRGDWDDATHPHERNKASYRPDNFLPLAEAGVLDLVTDDQTIVPGIKVQRTGGHAMHHQMVWIESKGASAAYVADLMPTVAHLPDAWIMGYDLYPMDTLAAKKAFVEEAVARHALVFFEHDPAVAAGRIVQTDGKRSIMPETL